MLQRYYVLFAGILLSVWEKVGLSNGFILSVQVDLNWEWCEALLNETKEDNYYWLFDVWTHSIEEELSPPLILIEGNCIQRIVRHCGGHTYK